MSDYHIPVMLNEVLEYLDVKPGAWYVDCNLGGGGHTEAILERGGKVIGIDLDLDSISYVATKYNLKRQTSVDRHMFVGDNLILVQGNFAQLEEIVREVQSHINPSPDLSPKGRGDQRKGYLKIKGILYDLGVSSYQLETPERGFSFNQDAPLDMRMDTSKQSATAADLINGLHEGELSELFLKLGEVSFGKIIAKKIVQSRKFQPITTTLQLAKIVESAKRREGKTHPATKVFQALRIAVNDELNNLKTSLPQAFEILEPWGRLVVISFHSLEDRIVKEFSKGIGYGVQGKVITKKPLEPSEKEILQNPRARSGKLRVIEK